MSRWQTPWVTCDGQTMIVNTLGWIGQTAIRFFIHLTNISYLARDILYWLFIGPWRGRPLRRRSIVREMDELGARSFPLICVMSVSLGAVLVILVAPQFRTFGVTEYVPELVTVFLVRELSPLLTGVVLAGRVGSMVTARLGAMASDNEILALEVMAIDPVEYLIVPRFVATVVMLPCLTILADLIGMVASLMIATAGLGLQFHSYLDGMLYACTLTDISFSLLKSVLFGVVIILVACYQGVIVEPGAEGVGQATMISVVTCTILVIVLNGMLSMMFYL